MSIPEFLHVLKSIAIGRNPEIIDYAVCVECKLNENECMYEKGLTCLGPITKAGCNSWCINYGNICYGCRGMVKETTKNASIDVIKKYDIPMDWIMAKYDMYNKATESEEKK